MKVNKLLVLALAVIILSATAVGSVSTTNNSTIGGRDPNKYTLANLSHLKIADFRAYVEAKHTNPLSDQVNTLRDQGLDNASIEKTFSDNGITYNSTTGAFVLAGGYTPTPEAPMVHCPLPYVIRNVYTQCIWDATVIGLK